MANFAYDPRTTARIARSVRLLEYADGRVDRLEGALPTLLQRVEENEDGLLGNADLESAAIIMLCRAVNKTSPRSSHHRVYEGLVGLANRVEHSDAKVALASTIRMFKSDYSRELERQPLEDPDGSIQPL